MEQPPSYYDEVFASSPSYALPPDQAPWSFLWRWCAAQVKPSDIVLELGCGPGHLASMLTCRDYLGIDFSGVAIAQAMARCDGTFMRGRLPDCCDLLAERWFDVVVACEFLEHIEDDLGVLERVEYGVRVVATLPRKDSRGHVRWFSDPGQVQDRYGGMVDVQAVKVWPTHVGFVGRRR